ncbi:hypothetical protein DO97_04225 [Neosynechococcus sphagnicola sy1]|uniref:Uncharacterized protein n=1 Tax=Neosynechococcus sphagnicola sy1 TaxID=1497020 RepID=A0A098TKV0_9CYAN|nr:hypothetical protein DO97_04225 [Neosynechococcus sphagnicola sy1]
MAENRGTIQFISTHKLVLMPPDGHRIVLMSPHMGMNPLTQGFKVGEEVVVVSDAKCFALKVSYPDKVIVSTLSVPEAMVPLAVTPIPVVTPSPIIPRPVEPVRGMW